MTTSKPTLIVATTVTTLALTMAGCAKTDVSTTTAPSSPSTPGSATQTPSPSATPPPSVPAAPSGSVPLGTSATHTSQTNKWAITLNRARCGLHTIPGAKLNPAWTGANGAPQYVAVTPAKGKALCELLWTWKNQGNSAVTVGMGGDLVLDSGQRLTRTQDEAMWSIATSKTQLNSDLMALVPAGGIIRRLDIYEIPAGSIPVAVAAPQGPDAQLFATVK